MASLNPNAPVFTFNASATSFVPPSGAGGGVAVAAGGDDLELDEQDLVFDQAGGIVDYEEFDEEEAEYFVEPVVSASDAAGSWRRAEGESMPATIGSYGNSSGAEMWPYVIVIMGVDKSKSIRGLLQDFANSCGPIRSHHFRDNHTLQIAFEDKNSVDRAVETMGKASIEGNRLLTVRRSRADSNAGYREPEPSPPAGAEEKTSTLVLKNLPYTLQKEQLEERMKAAVGPAAAPMMVTYHLDATGTFRGVVFVKYRSVEEASEACDALRTVDVAGRRIRVEYKRKAGTKGLGTDLESLDDETRAVCDQIVAYAEAQEASSWRASTTEREPLVIPTATLAPMQRKRVHALAEKLGLAHVSSTQADGGSVGASDEKHITVWRQSGRDKQAASLSSSYGGGAGSAGPISIGSSGAPRRGTGTQSGAGSLQRGFEIGSGQQRPSLGSYERDKGNMSWGSSSLNKSAPWPASGGPAKLSPEPSPPLSGSPGITFKNLETLRNGRSGSVGGANVAGPAVRTAAGPTEGAAFTRVRRSVLPPFIKVSPKSPAKDSSAVGSPAPAPL